MIERKFFPDFSFVIHIDLLGIFSIGFKIHDFKIKLLAECKLIFKYLYIFINISRRCKGQFTSLGNVIFTSTWEPTIYVSPVYY